MLVILCGPGARPLQAQDAGVLAVGSFVEPTNDPTDAPTNFVAVSIDADRDADYNPLSGGQGYGASYIRTPRRSSAGLSYTSSSEPSSVMECAQQPGTLISSLPAGRDYQASGKQVVFELLGGYPSDRKGIVYCDNRRINRTAAFLTGVGAVEFIGTEVRLDLERGVSATIAVLRGRVLFTPSGEVPWLAGPIFVEEGQQLTLDLAAPRDPVPSPYAPSETELVVFANLRERGHTPSAPPSPTGSAQVLIERTSIAFGAQQVGVPSRPEFVPIANTGGEPLTVDVSSPSPEFRVDRTNCPSSLQAGGTCVLTVSFTPAAAGARVSSMEVTTNATPGLNRITLSGSGVSDPKCSPPTSAIGFFSSTPVPNSNQGSCPAVPNSPPIF